MVAAALAVSGAAVVLAGGWLVLRIAPSVITGTGQFLLFYSGVFALVTLTLSVVVGLAATDRLVLVPQHRIQAQAVHRAIAFVAVAGVTVHVAAELVDARIPVTDAFLPFRAGGDTSVHAVELGLGTVAYYLMIALAASGIVRGRFAVGNRPWLWRLLHWTAYVAWPLAIVHGLTSGRTPAGWVILGYGLCLGAVALALPARFFLRAGSRRPR
jgi:DMSO/TMAO reductase YedYZ heme-binding membrane subunit